jgi:hypothetical protein
MVESVRVAWSIFGPEAPFDLVACGLETELPLWGDCEDGVLAAVNIISARYFEDATWEKLFGLDMIEAEVLFQIDAPAHMAGSYEVALRRVTIAECRKIDDPRLPRGCAPGRVGSLALVERA